MHLARIPIQWNIIFEGKLRVMPQIFYILRDSPKKNNSNKILGMKKSNNNAHN